VEKIWKKCVWRAKIRIWKGSGIYLEDCKGSGEKNLQFGAKGGVYV
jgi:predicted nucleic acid-binding Zn ribbon protein